MPQAFFRQRDLQALFNRFGQWRTAAAGQALAAGATGLDHVVVEDASGAVAVVEARHRRIVAVTGPQPAVGLLLFDLRTCLGDAFPGEEASS